MKKYSIIGLIAAISIMLPSLMVFGAYSWDLRSTPGGAVWSFSTTDTVGDQLYLGKEVVVQSIQYSEDDGLNWETVSLEDVRKIVYTQRTVRIVIDVSALPPTATHTKVTGIVGTSEPFEATGPGFARRRGTGR